MINTMLIIIIGGPFSNPYEPFRFMCRFWRCNDEELVLWDSIPRTRNVMYSENYRLIGRLIDTLTGLTRFYDFLT